MTTKSRPLSPHLQVYRWQLTMVLSIVHRATGVFLTFGTLLLAYWLLALAAGPEAYARAQAFMGSWIGLVLLFLWTGALFYHLCNGIRHLFWDAGCGYDIPQAYASGRAVVIAAIVLTILSWIIGLGMSGGAA